MMALCISSSVENFSVEIEFWIFACYFTSFDHSYVNGMIITHTPTANGMLSSELDAYIAFMELNEIYFDYDLECELNMDNMCSVYESINGNVWDVILHLSVALLNINSVWSFGIWAKWPEYHRLFLSTINWNRKLSIAMWIYGSLRINMYIFRISNFNWHVDYVSLNPGPNVVISFNPLFTQ